MKVDFIRSGRDKKHVTVLLRECYREDGKVKNRTLANISHLDPGTIEAIRLATRLKGDLPRLLEEAAQKSDATGVRQGRSIGALLVVEAILQRLGISKALGKDRQGRLAQWQVAARVLEQGSRLSAVRLARSHHAELLLGDEAMDENDLYRNLDWLCQNQAAIEDDLFRHRHPDGGCTLYLYDVTSSYLEGSKNALAAYGYNRDRKSGRAQIVMGLLCDGDGAPLSVEVFAGNTGDPSTVASQIRKVTERFGGGEVVFVGDRGMIRSRQQHALQDQDIHYLTAITKSQINTLLDRGTLDMCLFDENLAEVETTENGRTVRYLLRRNPIREADLAWERQARLEAFRKALARQNAYLAEHPRASVEKALGRLQKRLDHMKLPGITLESGEGRTVTMMIDEERLAEEARLDGCYALKTDVPQEMASAETLHARYKDLGLVEKAFRNLKTGHLQLRPIWLRLEDRTRGHALVCMLAYLVRRELEACWTRFDGTVAEHLRELDSLCSEEMLAAGTVLGCRIPEPRASVKALLDAAGVKIPTRCPYSEPPAVATCTKLTSRRKSR